MNDQELAEKVVHGMLANDPFSAWLGIEPVSVLPGECTVQMTIRKEMLNGFDVCHGGITFSLADSAFAFASNTQGKISVSIRNTISYPKAVREGDVLKATAKEAASSSRIAFYDVTVTNQADEKVAIFEGTVYRTKRDFLESKGIADGSSVSC